MFKGVSNIAILVRQMMEGVRNLQDLYDVICEWSVNSVLDTANLPNLDVENIARNIFLHKVA